MESAATNLQQPIIKKDVNQCLFAYVSGAEWQNIIALELSYHRSCYINLIRKDNRRSRAADSQDPAIEKLCESIKAIVLLKCELVFINKLPILYSDYILKTFQTKQHIGSFSNQALRRPSCNLSLIHI